MVRIIPRSTTVASSESRLVEHLLAPGSLALAALVWLLLESPHTNHNLIAEISGWAAVGLLLFLAIFLALADIMHTRRRRRTPRS